MPKRGPGRVKKEVPAKDFKPRLWAVADKLRPQIDALISAFVEALILFCFICDACMERWMHMYSIVISPGFGFLVSDLPADRLAVLEG